MPLFRKTWDSQSFREPEPVPSSPSRRRTGLFNSRRSVNDTSTRRTGTYAYESTRPSPTNSTSGGFFSHRRSFETSSDRSFGRSSREESSILAAKQKVADAENAESVAGDALRQARNAVREAKEHIRMLEDEAREE